MKLSKNTKGANTWVTSHPLRHLHDAHPDAPPQSQGKNVKNNAKQQELVRQQLLHSPVGGPQSGPGKDFK